MNSDFTKQLDKYAKLHKRIPQRMASVAVNFSKERFRQKNWVDTKREPWKPRQEKKGHGSTMVASGRLKRSIRKLRVAKNYAIIGTNVKYAELHNNGGVIKQKVTVKGHKRDVRVQRQRTNLRTRKTTKQKGRVTIGQTTVKQHTRQMNTKMPARTFIGESKVLARRIERQIIKDYQQAFKQL